jgi:two-component system, NarL family, response regulator LiaR
MNQTSEPSKWKTERFSTIWKGKTMEQIRVLIVDDHSLFRTGVVTLINSEPGMKVVGEATNGEEAVRLAGELQVDVIVIDLVMPRMDGVQAIQKIHSQDPSIRILVLSTFAEKKDVLASIKAGATGYLLKDTSPNQLLQAIRDVHSGQPSLHPQVAKILIQDVRADGTPQRQKPLQEPIEKLTPREMEVLTLIARGRTNDEIANRLMISKRTVNTYINGILRKLNLNNRAQIVLYALNTGVVDLDQGDSF